MIDSGVLSAMSAMVNLEIPWINVLSKMDLVTPDPDDPTKGARNGIRRRKNITRYLDPDPLLLSAPLGQEDEGKGRNPRFHALNEAIVQLVRYFV
jgi:GPN-loop GTPase